MNNTEKRASPRRSLCETVPEGETPGSQALSRVANNATEDSKASQNVCEEKSSKATDHGDNSIIAPVEVELQRPPSTMKYTETDVAQHQTPKEVPGATAADGLTQPLEDAGAAAALRSQKSTNPFDSDTEEEEEGALLPSGASGQLATAAAVPVDAEAVLLRSVIELLQRLEQKGSQVLAGAPCFSHRLRQGEGEEALKELLQMATSRESLLETLRGCLSAAQDVSEEVHTQELLQFIIAAEEKQQQEALKNEESRHMCQEEEQQRQLRGQEESSSEEQTERQEADAQREQQQMQEEEERQQHDRQVQQRDEQQQMQQEELLQQRLAQQEKEQETEEQQRYSDCQDQVEATTAKDMNTAAAAPADEEEAAGGDTHRSRSEIDTAAAPKEEGGSASPSGQEVPPSATAAEDRVAAEQEAGAAVEQDVAAGPPHCKGVEDSPLPTGSSEDVGVSWQVLRAAGEQTTEGCVNASPPVQEVPEALSPLESRGSLGGPLGSLPIAEDEAEEIQERLLHHVAQQQQSAACSSSSLVFLPCGGEVDALLREAEKEGAAPPRGHTTLSDGEDEAEAIFSVFLANRSEVCDQGSRQLRSASASPRLDFSSASPRADLSQTHSGGALRSSQSLARFAQSPLQQQQHVLPESLDARHRGLVGLSADELSRHLHATENPLSSSDLFSSGTVLSSARPSFQSTRLSVGSTRTGTQVDVPCRLAYTWGPPTPLHVEEEHLHGVPMLQRRRGAVSGYDEDVPNAALAAAAGILRSSRSRSNEWRGRRGSEDLVSAQSVRLVSNALPSASSTFYACRAMSSLAAQAAATRVAASPVSAPANASSEGLPMRSRVVLAGGAAEDARTPVRRHRGPPLARIPEVHASHAASIPESYEELGETTPRGRWRGEIRTAGCPSTMRPLSRYAPSQLEKQPSQAEFAAAGTCVSPKFSASCRSFSRIGRSRQALVRSELQGIPLRESCRRKRQSRAERRRRTVSNSSRDPFPREVGARGAVTPEESTDDLAAAYCVAGRKTYKRDQETQALIGGSTAILSKEERLRDRELQERFERLTAQERRDQEHRRQKQSELVPQEDPDDALRSAQTFLLRGESRPLQWQPQERLQRSLSERSSVGRIGKRHSTAGAFPDNRCSTAQLSEAVEEESVRLANSVHSAQLEVQQEEGARVYEQLEQEKQKQGEEETRWLLQQQQEGARLLQKRRQQFEAVQQRQQEFLCARRQERELKAMASREGDGIQSRGEEKEACGAEAVRSDTRSAAWCAMETPEEAFEGSPDALKPPQGGGTAERRGSRLRAEVTPRAPTGEGKSGANAAHVREGAGRQALQRRLEEGAMSGGVFEIASGADLRDADLEGLDARSPPAATAALHLGYTAPSKRSPEVGADDDQLVFRSLESGETFGKARSEVEAGGGGGKTKEFKASLDRLQEATYGFGSTEEGQEGCCELRAEEVWTRERGFTTQQHASQTAEAPRLDPPKGHTTDVGVETDLTVQTPLPDVFELEKEDADINEEHVAAGARQSQHQPGARTGPAAAATDKPRKGKGLSSVQEDSEVFGVPFEAEQQHQQWVANIRAAEEARQQVAAAAAAASAAAAALEEAAAALHPPSPRRPPSAAKKVRSRPVQSGSFTSTSGDNKETSREKTATSGGGCACEGGDWGEGFPRRRRALPLAAAYCQEEQQRAWAAAEDALKGVQLFKGESQGECARHGGTKSSDCCTLEFLVGLEK
ncbi:nuclear mitotic apparatus protein 1-like [Cyclospora cayetanensis]|uniref:Nuclear mitotic apparatus protein 1-like n=1 Tax=Cyclospora cayetanensis TaxID=88456 RepID=A0A6P6RQ66_9EIME|nr:nuclear mitotic apparatus protein 1-like [Cyclospora cayetanensis]